MRSVVQATVLAVTLCVSRAAIDRDALNDAKPPLGEVWKNVSDAHAEGDTTSMFSLSRTQLTDSVLEQLATESAYSRAYVDSKGSPCQNPGNAKYTKNIFNSHTEDGHEDKVLRWEPADTNCELPVDIDFRKEFANKTVWFAGNSLSRGTFWQLSSLIDHNSEVQHVDREMQKHACSKTGNRALSCHLKPEGTPHMYFSWIQTLDRLATEIPMIAAALPNEPDVVVYNLGLQHLLFDKTSWYPKQQRFFPEVIKAMRTAWPNARIVYLPVSPANENNDRVRNHWHLENLNILRWNREAFEMVEEYGLEWIPVVEPVMRGWTQQLAYDKYGYLDHFHPSAHLYSLWCRMLASILRQPAHEISA